MTSIIIKGSPKIFICPIWTGNAFQTHALAEDGCCLHVHVARDLQSAAVQMGITKIIGLDPIRHSVYRSHYPKGFDLVWLPTKEQRDNNLEYQQACRLNREINPRLI